MTPPTAAQLTADAATLSALGAWLLSVDVAAPGLPALSTGLRGAMTSLSADWAAANPGTPSLTAETGPELAGDAATAIDAMYNAIYGGAGYGYTSSGAPARLQQDAAMFAQIATRVAAGTVTAADVTWLQNEAAYLASAFTAANTLHAASAALAGSNMESIAETGSGDSAGAAAVSNATTGMDALYAFFYAANGVPAGLAEGLVTNVIPDLQALLAPAAALPPIVGAPVTASGAPQSLALLAQAITLDTSICAAAANPHVVAFVAPYNQWKWTTLGSPATFTPPIDPATTTYGATVQAAVNDVLGAGKAPTCQAAPGPAGTTTTSSNGTVIAVGVAAAAGLGLLAWKMRKAASVRRTA
jgi:hypothetical protein